MIGTEVFQAIGGLIIVAAFAQLAVLLYGTWRGAALARVRQGLDNELLRQRVDAETLSGEVERNKTVATWSGLRKFRIRDKIQDGGDICSFYLVPHDGKALPPFAPGQYLTFNLRLPDRDKPLVRCYSLSDSPFQTDYYRVSIKRQGPPPREPEAPPGLGSYYFHDELNTGDIVDVKAPSGNFFLDLSKHGPVVLIGGGVGLTPMLSMLNAICESGSQRETWLFYGVRNGDEHIVREHLEALEAAFGRGRDFGAWLGLVPRQYSTGGRPILGRISKRGSKYLRTLFIQAAHVIMMRPHNWLKFSFGPWLTEASTRLHRNKLATALANKLARIAWSVLANRKAFDANRHQIEAI